MHWIAYALANHLCGLNETAIKVIDAYNKTISQEQANLKPNYEDSELALYRNVILEEEGRYEDALAHLDECQAIVVDVRAWRERRAQLLLYLRKGDERASPPVSSIQELRAHDTSSEAVRAWIELLTSNVPSAENYAYHRGLQLALLVEVPADRCRELLLAQRACELPTDVLPLGAEQVRRLNAAYTALSAANPRAEAYRWLPLLYAGEGPDFDCKLDATVRRMTKKGAPALGSSLERLWDPKAGENIEGRVRGRMACERTLKLIEAHISSLRQTGQYASFASLESSVAALSLDEEREKTVPNGDVAAGTSRTQDEAAPEPPTSILWALYLRAHCLEWLGELEAALATIDECVAHTPSAVDFYEKRARLLKRSGEVAEAAEAMDRARQLDLADRYINNKATKYLLRAGKIADARRTASLFTRPEAGDAELHLKEMQAYWYELEVGRALARDRQKGPALKKFVAVLKHFADFIDDQFDFHTYCVRRMTLRAYVSVLRFEDCIRGHVAFRRAAVAAARIFLGVHDEKIAADDAMQKLSHEQEKATPEDAAKSAEDAAAAKARAKREKMKQRKARAKEAKLAREEEHAASPAVESHKSSSASSERKHAEDDDPIGAKLLAESRPPLVEAADLVDQLEKYAPSRPETHVLAFDVADRKAKPLLAVRALCRLDARCCRLHYAPTKADLRCYADDFYSPHAARVDRLSRFVVRFAGAVQGNGVVAQVARTFIARLCGADDAADQSALATLVLAEVRALCSEAAVLPVRVAAARALVRLDPAARAEATQLVLQASFEELPSGKPLGIKHFEAALNALEDDIGAQHDQIECFRELARVRFPRASVFAQNLHASKPAL